MKNIQSLVLALASALFAFDSNAQNFADGFIFYNPGTNFASGFTNAATSLGQPTTTATPFSPAFRNTQLVSLGAGGSLTVQFNTPITNDSAHPFGLDFTIFGNAGFVITNGNFSGGGITDGSLLGNNIGATRVWVSADNLTYYQLNPLLAPTVDSLFPTDGGANFLKPVNPALGQSDFNGQNLAGIRALYDGSAGGSSYDISWAQDSLGDPVPLNEISFVRVDVLSGKSEIDGFSIVAVPEPRAWALLVCGLLWLISYRKRRCSKLIAVAAMLAFACSSNAKAGTVTEDFSTNPAVHGWTTFGNSNLFLWNSTNQNMEVTWDSSQPNSYFYRPLGTILAKDDDFSVEFDMQLSNFAAGGFGFETAVGLLNIGDATNSSFLRGTGNNSPNLVEFNFFPDTGFGPTLSASLADTNSQIQFLYDTNGFDNSVRYHVKLAHTAGSVTIAGSIYTNYPANPQLYTTLPLAFLSTNFTDFRVDSISISSYSDGGSGDSILAHGIVDNFAVTLPLPPVQNMTGGFSNSVWQVQFTSQSNWVYTLERSAGLQTWSPASPTVPGSGGTLTLQDTDAPADRAFYRVRANRP